MDLLDCRGKIFGFARLSEKQCSTGGRRRRRRRRRRRKNSPSQPDPSPIGHRDEISRKGPPSLRHPSWEVVWEPGKNVQCLCVGTMRSGSNREKTLSIKDLRFIAILTYGRGRRVWQDTDILLRRCTILDSERCRRCRRRPIPCGGGGARGFWEFGAMPLINFRRGV